MDEDARLDALRAGDEAAFLAVFGELQPRLLRYLSTMVGPDDAQDVAGEAWAQAIRDLDRFRGTRDDFRGWVTTIARHRALDLLRSRARHPFVDVDPVEHLRDTSVGVSAEAEALEGIGTEAALRLIASLPPEQAEAVLLRSVMALDAKTAGRVLGRRPGAVRTAAYRGLLGLRVASVTLSRPRTLKRHHERSSPTDPPRGRPPPRGARFGPGRCAGTRRRSRVRGSDAPPAPG